MPGEVRIDVTADDRTGPAIDSAGRGIEGLGNRAARAGTGFDALARGAQTAAGYLERGYAVMTRLDLTQISLQQSGERVRVAQEKYNEALMQHGPASQQAAAASRELDSAQAALEKTQLRAHLSYVMVGADLVTMAAQAPKVIAGIAGIGTASLATARSLTVMQVAGGAATLALAGFVAAATLLQEKAEKGSTAVEELRLAEEALAEMSGNSPFGGPILGTIEKLAGKIPGITTDTETYANAIKRVQEAQAAVDAERVAERQHQNAQATTAAKTAALELAEANQRLASGTRAAYGSIGVDLSKFSQEFQEQMLRNAGVTDDFIASMRPVVTAEQLLAASSGEAREALLAQLDVTNRKGESTEDLAKRLGLTSDEEARLREEGRWTTEGIVSQDVAARGLASTLGGSGGAVAANLASAQAALGGNTLPGWVGAQMQAGDPFGGGRGGFNPIGLGMASLLNTAPGVDVTGVQRGLYAPFGGGFVSGGRIGSQDLGSAYGSRTIVNQHTGQALVGRNDAQGSGQVNMGGVTIVVYAQGASQQAVQSGVLGAMSQVQTRTAARRTV